ncbi:hypothetical protein ACHHYP_00653 [Achlya hypogyna]|uniref:Transmembrane protein n=1 Tax=Achlya hypogyna TaxID=1202772 RepID=A0A1V9ZU07_ACHHY|nr:hypothetical protein ACHHYP_00653 [Achlya hypogyna]
MLAKLVAVAALTGAYFRPTQCLDALSWVLSPVVGLDELAASAHSALFVRLVLTLVAFATAVARTRSTYLTFIAVLVCLQTACLQLHLQGETYAVLPWSKPVQLVFFEILATLTFTLVLTVGYFAPLPLSPRQVYRKRLEDFYKTHNPAKLGQVDDILRRYRHHEEVLFTRLKKKYITNDLSESEEGSDDEHETSTDDEPAAAPTRATAIHIETTVEDDVEDVQEPSTPPASANQGRADTAPRVRTAIQEVQAAQQARIEERIQRLKMGKAKA